MKTNWVTIYDRKNCQIDLERQKVEVTMTEDTGHWKSEMGGAYEKFLEGSFHELVLKQFSEVVLAEVIASVEELVGRSVLGFLLIKKLRQNLEAS